ncbi:MAG: MerR family transcriptional regulator [Roseovarius sp.]|nr:MerR family transcriptional regulator [Roseovarius sp.]
MAKSDEAFRTIGEVADWLNTPSHVLRFWESKFKEIKPIKGTGGRRYYRPCDMLLIGGIKKLLHEDGMTIKSVQAYLLENGNDIVSSHSKSLNFNENRQLDETTPKRERKAGSMESGAFSSAAAKAEFSNAAEQPDTSGGSTGDNGTAMSEVDEKAETGRGNAFSSAANDPDDDVKANSGLLTFLASFPRCLAPDQKDKLRLILARLEKTA